MGVMKTAKVWPEHFCDPDPCCLAYGCQRQSAESRRRDQDTRIEELEAENARIVEQSDELHWAHDQLKRERQNYEDRIVEMEAVIKAAVFDHESHGRLRDSTYVHMQAVLQE